MSKKRIPAKSSGTSRHLKETKPGLSNKTIGFLLAVFAFLLYANTLNHGYVLDDNLAMANNPKVAKGISGILEIFSQPYRELCFGGCLYRPVTLTTFALEWTIAPNKPVIGHWMNVLWYAATSLLLFHTLRRLFTYKSLWISIAGTVLFIAHPIHTEVVANIKSRDEILSAFFVILTLYWFVQWYQSRAGKYIAFAAIAYLAALLSKEGAVTMMAVFPLLGWIFYQQKFLDSLKHSWWILVSALIFFALRGFALAGLTSPEIHMIDNPLVEADGLERIGTSMVVLGKYLVLLIFPFKLINDYSYNAVPLASFFSIGGLVSFVLYAGITGFAIYGLIKRKVAGFFAFAFLCCLFLYSQLVVLIGTLMGERLAYLPSLWFVVGITYVLFEISKVESTSWSPWKYQPAAQRYLLIGIAVVTLMFSFRIISRNANWKNDYTLATTDVKKSPNSLRLHDHVAEEMYKSSGDPTLTADQIDERLKITEEHAQKSLAIKPGLLGYNYMGHVKFTRKEFEEAIRYYQKAKEVLPGYKEADQHTIHALYVWANEESEKKQNHTKALELLERALTFDPNEPKVLQLLGRVYFRLSRKEEALAAFEKAYSFVPNDPNIKEELKSMYILMGTPEKAEELK